MSSRRPSRVITALVALVALVVVAAMTVGMWLPLLPLSTRATAALRLADTLGDPRRCPTAASCAISPKLRSALVADADPGFYGPGPSPGGPDGDASRGGETLTQQYADLLLSHTGVPAETATALDRLQVADRLNRQMSKDRILNGYLELVDVGPNTHGIRAAARRWFDADPAHVSLAQAATLIGMVRHPGDPAPAPDTVHPRRDAVLRRMRDAQVITPAQLDTALDAPLALARPVPAPASATPTLATPATP